MKIAPNNAVQYFFLALALLQTAVHGKQITPYETTRPNEFYFTSDVYYVDEDATNAVIEVGFVPGDRSYSGSVNYSTTNGSAQCGQDYVGVTNTLSFSGPAPTRTFTIPIQKDALCEGNETVQLVLSSGSAFITRSTATLIIVDKTAPPKLDMTKSNNTLTLSWPTNFTNCALQKSGNLTSWVNMAAAPTVSNGRYNVTAQATTNTFFRLKINNAP
ncbi:MAG: hypothetical protein JWM68_3369 [Verrucomicrobiales bacterium]|nr:hypothetical protein [Verrucomicrobiales bacterium]